MNKLVCTSASTRLAYNNYKKTVINQILSDDILNFADIKINKLSKNHSKKLSLWGCKHGNRILSKWSNIDVNDYLLFYSQGKFISLSRIIGLISSKSLSQKFWNTSEYSLVILLDENEFFSKCKDNFWSVFTYSPTAKIQGLTVPKINVQKEIFNEITPLRKQIIDML